MTNEKTYGGHTWEDLKELPHGKKFAGIALDALPDLLVQDVQAITSRTRAEFERIFNETETWLQGRGSAPERSAAN
jgi:hypothetical protein